MEFTTGTGGFFDRTLAFMITKPRVFGVGYSELFLPTIYPQPHDVPMDWIVTEAGARSRGAHEVEA